MDDRQALDLAALHSAAKTGLIPQHNASVFRYVALKTEAAFEHTRTTLLYNKIPLAAPNSLNDAFEVRPNIVNDLAPGDVNERLRGIKFAEDSATSFIFDTEHMKVARADGTTFTAFELENEAAKIIAQATNDYFRKSRIASFSRRISSQLLWAHYADGYRGMAYHFINRCSESSILFKMKPVRYVAQRPIVSLSEMLKVISRKKSGNIGTLLAAQSLQERFYLQKSLDWSYEEEERIVVDEHADNSFLPEELATIIVGPHFPDAHLKRLKEIICERNRPVRIFKSRISQTDFSIEVDWSVSI